MVLEFIKPSCKGLLLPCKMALETIQALFSLLQFHGCGSTEEPFGELSSPLDSRCATEFSLLRGNVSETRYLVASEEIFSEIFFTASFDQGRRCCCCPSSLRQFSKFGTQVRKYGRLKSFFFVFEMSTLASKNAQGASATGQLHMTVTCALRWAGRLFRVAAQQQLSGHSPLPRRFSFRYRPHFHGRRWADAQQQNWKQTQMRAWSWRSVSRSRTCAARLPS